MDASQTTAAVNGEGANGTGKSPLELKSNDPLILAMAINALGHLVPMLQITQYMVSKGYEVHFLTARDRQAMVEDVGASFIPAVGTMDWPVEHIIADVASRYEGNFTGLGNYIFYSKVMSQAMIGWTDSIRSALVTLRTQYQDREIVVLMDCFNLGVVPFKLGAELPAGFDEFPKILGISVIPPTWTSKEYGMLVGMKPTRTPVIFSRPPHTNTQIGNSKKFEPPTSGTMQDVLDLASLRKETVLKRSVEDMELLLRAMGARKPWESLLPDPSETFHLPMELMICVPDKTLQLCSPSLELPVSDMPKNFGFAGTLPAKHKLNKEFQAPKWWNRITENSARENADKPDRKRIIMVAQGTIATNYEDLIVQTIKGLAHRDDLIVVAILGIKNATLEQFGIDLQLPENTIVVDYFPYDTLLEHTDAFIANGSYGVFSHCIAHGVPMVLSGETEDKPDMGVRGEYAGFAINLRAQRPDPRKVEGALDQILTEEKFKRRALELKREAAEAQSLEVIEKELRALFS